MVKVVCFIVPPVLSMVQVLSDMVWPLGFMGQPLSRMVICNDESLFGKSPRAPGFEHRLPIFPTVNFSFHPVAAGNDDGVTRKAALVLQKHPLRPGDDKRPSHFENRLHKIAENTSDPIPRS